MRLICLISFCAMVGQSLLAQSSLLPSNYLRGQLNAPTLQVEGIAPVHAIAIGEHDAAAVKETGLTQHGLAHEMMLGATDVELTTPQFYLGDEIPLPSGKEIDWQAFYEDLQKEPRQYADEHFLVDPHGRRVYAIAGGAATMNWPLVDKTTLSITYQIAYSCKGRPKRVFWTNNPYKGPVVSLNNSFVKLVGDPNLLNLVKRDTTIVLPGVNDSNQEVVINQEVVHGIYIDESSNSIHVIQGDRTKYGDLRGQFVAAYYKSGSYEELLGLQVVEVSQPEPVMLKGYVGEPLKPDGGGFPIDGLQAYPTMITPTDDKGAYYYQHLATTANNPQNRQVFPLRPTDSANMRLQVWWKEADPFDTLWPFEQSTYDCVWSEHPLTQVVGVDGGTSLPLMVGAQSGYTPTVERCFEGVKTVTQDVSNASYTVTFEAGATEGYWTLRLTSGDNIWFVPVRAVANTNTDWFSADAVEWLVGEEIVPRGGDLSGLGNISYATEVNDSLPGYIYEHTSAPIWNPQLYQQPSAETSLESISSLPSAIFPVCAAKKDAEKRQIEVWWQGSYQQEGMPQPITSPTLVQRYMPRWPEMDEAPAIVLASGLGSAGKSIAQSGKAMKLATANASLELPERRFFKEGGTLAFWMNRNGAREGQILQLGNVAKDYTLTLLLQAEELKLEIVGLASDDILTTQRTLTAKSALPANTWVFVALTFERSENPKVTLQIEDDVKAVCHLIEADAADEGFDDVTIDLATNSVPTGTNYPRWPIMKGGQLFEVLAGGIGAMESTLAAEGVLLDEISLWRKPFSKTALIDLAHRHPDKHDTALTLAYTFEANADLEVLATTDTNRMVTDVVTDVKYRGVHLAAHTPGAPLKGAGIIISDTEPTIYRQPDPNAVGYNPNEEHAFIRAGDGGYTVWAFRCDLNRSDAQASSDKDDSNLISKPGVLVSYTLDGRAKMKWLGVQATSEFYPTFSGTCMAGSILPGPHPFDLMPDPWVDPISWKDGGQKNTPAYRDRKGQIWARCEGKLDISMYYRNDPSFDSPGKTDTEDMIEWLPAGSYKDSAGKDITTWHWDIKWPDNVPTLKLGQTLTTAINGLPEVWCAKSLSLVYADADAILFDPTCIQATGPKANYGIPTTTDFIRFLGLVPGEDGVSYKGGRYTFSGAPASVADRFYIDATAEITACVRLRGEMEEKNAGTSMLHLNLLNEQERKELGDLFNDKGDSVTNVWWKLFNTPVEGKRFAEKAEPVSFVATTINTNANAQVEWNTTYKPVDHYALTAKSLSATQSGYLALLENDNPDPTIVDEGDPISMHIVKVVPELYTGALLVREDPTNLLSQQLSVLYTEGFAGDANDFTFEWKWAEPTASGRIPENYEEGYMLHAREEGLTRFLIGAQGDTLENMVNRYFVMRYKPKAGSAVLEALKAAIQERDGDATLPKDDDPRLWSDWCGPTLAEGWIQRVLNNVTPFTQRMTDLYTNPTETAVTMIQQAGGPYVGDVALNQDNLTNVGLIQLYATLLNKAETMSINQTSGTGAVNDQLLLAATRLADLYCVLGDEAYADALNPTIGFGADFARVEDANIGIDYGALSSALFCFDNQVPSLLDEELALLRGRSAEDAPSKQVGPWYNRLVWNFTKGINAGEVAYAVNYNVTGSETGILDEETAAKLYPQGHGDAYGHYLSAVKTYYRLLRNPNFSWGTPGMGEMLMADAVVNNDYYEENRFSELAGALSKTAASIMERTAQKAWRDHGGLPGAGYLDEDRNRAFGYGEWGTRGALGAFYGWAVGNSLLPAGPQVEQVWQYHAIRPKNGPYPPTIVIPLPDACDTTQSADGALLPFTLEFQVEVIAEQPSLSNEITETMLFSLADKNGDDFLFVTRSQSGELTLSIQQGDAMPTHALGNLPTGERCLFALMRGEYAGKHGLHFTLLDSAGVRKWTTTIEEQGVQPAITLAAPELLLGCGTEGTFHEIRWWQGLMRTDEELHAARQRLISESTALKFALHTYADATTETVRDTVGRVACQLTGGSWTTLSTNGLSTDFRDDGLLRINRVTADALNDLPETLAGIMASLDQMDAGASPLGLEQNATPFDLSPVGLEDGSNTHFEQILERAEVALKNAATVLNHVQTLGNRLRQIQEAQAAYEEQLANQEGALDADLVAIYGKPYSGDIGPGKLYAQDYDGPDLFHYMYMDLSPYGLSDVPVSDSESLVLEVKLDDENYGYIADGASNLNVADGAESITLSYNFTADGFIAKPDEITGARRVTGSIQQAYADVLICYTDYIGALSAVKAQRDLIDTITKEMKSVFQSTVAYYECVTLIGFTLDAVTAILNTLTSTAFAAETSYQTTALGAEMIKNSTVWVVAGLSNGSDLPEKITANAATAVTGPLKITAKVTGATLEIAESIYNGFKDVVENELDRLGNEVSMRSTIQSYREDLLTQGNAYANAVATAQIANARLQAALQKIGQEINRGEGILAQRKRLRKQAADGIARLRYNDMFFRQLRNEALARYEKAFLLAQRYTYLTAQAYDYETCQLSSGSAGDDFRGEIIGARALGVLSAEGDPMLAGAHGDAGLSDILARMKADYMVLKPRLGINNPKKELTWFSLRRELLRLKDDHEGDAAWKAALERYTVADLRTSSEFMRYCRPLASSANNDIAEPGLIIPFETTIDFARNFFGNDLMGGDSAFSPTDFATRIAGTGVLFEGYNVPAAGVSSTPPLAATPQVYLVPAGNDYFRMPGNADKVLCYDVVDQTVPLPYNVGQSQLNDPDWQPLYDGVTGGADLGSRMRKYGSFRASIGSNAEETGSTRLIGRSVWNTRWLMIVPFGAMHADREMAMRSFIYGTSAYPGVRDILLGLRTYSHEGN